MNGFSYIKAFLNLWSFMYLHTTPVKYSIYSFCFFLRKKNLWGLQSILSKWVFAFVLNDTTNKKINLQWRWVGDPDTVFEPN